MRVYCLRSRNYCASSCSLLPSRRAATAADHADQGQHLPDSVQGWSHRCRKWNSYGAPESSAGPEVSQCGVSILLGQHPHLRELHLHHAYTHRRRALWVDLLLLLPAVLHGLRQEHGPLLPQPGVRPLPGNLREVKLTANTAPTCLPNPVPK